MQWARLRERLDEGDSPLEILRADEADAAPRLLEQTAAVISSWDDGITKLLTYLDLDFPQQLHDVYDYPPFLFARGQLTPPYSEVDRGICVVGSRHPSDASRHSAEMIAKGLCREGVTVIAGLADGVDQAAHRAALAAGGRTVGVIGTGIDRYYPTSSAPYQQRMESGEGLVLSQFWPGSSPTRYSFPMRNAVMSAYGQATIIIEASEKSGTRHQAAQAVRHGRPVVLSNSVAEQTSWGYELAADDAADVHVAYSVEQALSLAFDILERSPLPGPPPRLAAAF